jgi:hypothetical protein
MAISTDNVDPEVSEGAQRWHRGARRFMVVFRARAPPSIC